jgi:phosphoglucomutase
MLYTDPATGLAVADPHTRPIAAALASFKEDTQGQLLPLSAVPDTMILSVSGWRKVFAADANEESFSPRLTPSDTLAAAAAAAAFAEHLKEGRECDEPLEIVLGMDSRPTGPAIADAAIRILLAEGIRVRHLFIAAAPQLMAYTGLNGTSSGFFYITASHNPVGHNGIKFGRGGGVIGRGEAAQLIERFKTLCRDPRTPERLAEREAAADPEAYAEVLAAIPRSGYEACDIYRSFTVMTAASTIGVCGQDQVLSRIRTYTEQNGLGVVIDFNGSARACSIDRDFLRELGISVRTINDTPGRIAHRIIPEGSSLDPCREELERAYSEDPAFQLGYVPDNDGDRGNFVYIDEKSGKACTLEAQEVFALAVLSELAFSVVSAGSTPVKRAVVVNGPTSMRIDAVASCFQAEVHRCEVGEANTVELAARLRDSGYEVRILGEGSNGGNITHPAAVRDPLNTLMSFIKLLALQDDREQAGLFSTWCALSGQKEVPRNFTFADITASLPHYTTTGVSEPEAVLTIRTKSQAKLKAAYEALFEEQWTRERDGLFRKLGLSSWREFNTEGTVCREGTGAAFRTGQESGGLKIVFYDREKVPQAFIWMRGSGTEPVFRILADVKGNDREKERKLLFWHADLVRRADGLSS